MKITTNQVAGLLGITPQGVRMLALRGKLKRHGGGRQGWYDLDQVRELYATTRGRVVALAPQVSDV